MTSNLIIPRGQAVNAEYTFGSSAPVKTPQNTLFLTVPPTSSVNLYPLSFTNGGTIIENGTLYYQEQKTSNNLVIRRFFLPTFLIGTQLTTAGVVLRADVPITWVAASSGFSGNSATITTVIETPSAVVLRLNLNISPRRIEININPAQTVETGSRICGAEIDMLFSS